MDDTFTEMVGYMGFSHFLHVKCQFSVSLIVCFDFECFSSMCCFVVSNSHVLQLKMLEPVVVFMCFFIIEAYLSQCHPFL